MLCITISFLLSLQMNEQRKEYQRRNLHRAGARVPPNSVVSATL